VVFEKLNAITKKYEELSRKLADPEVVANPKEMQKLAKAHADLAGIVSVYQKYRQIESDLEVARSLLEEPLSEEEVALVKKDLVELEKKERELFQELKLLLLPKDPDDEKDVIVEIRAGTGGEEAALFAGDLFRMYTRYAEAQGWKVEIMSANPTELGGFKEIIFTVEGKGVYNRLKFESGVHRVQRVPVTEAGGRIHTSAASVIVLPEAEEVEVELDPNDLRIDVYRASGHGGQHVNTTDSAVRITHLPTGIVVSCQDEKSQLKNKEKALKILRARLLDQMRQKQQEELASTRRSLVRTGDRSERIRTYNFPQNRVTDHRVGLTLHRLDAIIAGDLEEIISTLLISEQTEKLKQADGTGG
jgi:peptide chain release factor 1